MFASRDLFHWDTATRPLFLTRRQPYPASDPPVGNCRKNPRVTWRSRRSACGCSGYGGSVRSTAKTPVRRTRKTRVPVFRNLKRSGASIPSVRETDDFLLVLPYGKRPRSCPIPACLLAFAAHAGKPTGMRTGREDNGKRGSNTRQVQSCITSVYGHCKEVC